jgi:hypothetical protein
LVNDVSVRIFIAEIKKQIVMKIDQFNKQNLKELRQELNKVLAQFNEKHGLNSSIGNINFTNDRFTTKLTVTTTKKPGLTMVSPEATEENGEIKMGDKFFQGRTEYTIVAINNPGKFQYSVETQNGKRYKIKKDHLLSMTKMK